MKRPAESVLRGSRCLVSLVVVAGVVLLSSCALSERGPDMQGFVTQVRQVLGELDQRDVAVSQLVGQRWQQVCLHREGSLNISLIELDTKHVIRIPYRLLSVHDAGSRETLDGKCLQRDERVRLRRTGKGGDAPIVIERTLDEGPSPLLAQQ